MIVLYNFYYFSKVFIQLYTVAGFIQLNIWYFAKAGCHYISRLTIVSRETRPYVMNE